MEKKEIIKSLILKHFKNRPLMRATDGYKLLFQGIFGVGHIIDEGAQLRLKEEAEAINKSDYPNEPLFESVSADGSIIRVNLRPFMRCGLSISKLYNAMVESMDIQGSSEEFLFAWSILNELASSGMINVDAEEINCINEELREKGPKPHHHSVPYRNAYYPAYRVVEKKTLENYIGQ
jgi:hypothetical protein